jgi:hypothetical protein
VQKPQNGNPFGLSFPQAGQVAIERVYDLRPAAGGTKPMAAVAIPHVATTQGRIGDQFSLSLW